MATGWNTTNTFADAMDQITDSARTVREYANVMGQLVDMTRLENNTGLTWKELVLNKLTAQNIQETTDLEENPQEIIDSFFTISLTQVGLSVFMTDMSKARMNSKVAAQLGVLTEHAMARKKDVDYIAIAQSATTDLGSGGNPMSSDLVGASVANIRGNTTEPWDGAVTTVMRTFHLKDIQDEGVAGLGTFPVPAGITEEFFRKGFSGTLYGSNVYTDDNISVDGSSNAIAFVFGSGSGGAIVAVEGVDARRVTQRKENIGGGAEILFCTDQYGTGVRQQAWMRAITADSTAPTS